MQNIAAICLPEVEWQKNSIFNELELKVEIISENVPGINVTHNNSDGVSC